MHVTTGSEASTKYGDRPPSLCPKIKCFIFINNCTIITIHFYTLFVENRMLFYRHFYTCVENRMLFYRHFYTLFVENRMSFYWYFYTLWAAADMDDDTMLGLLFLFIVKKIKLTKIAVLLPYSVSYECDLLLFQTNPSDEMSKWAHMSYQYFQPKHQWVLCGVSETM